MGLFDKKKSDDFNSPVERIDLSSVAAMPAPAAPGAAATSGGGRAAHAPQPAHEPESPRYGINQAIELMRGLPQDNVELVVQVVKRTLESTHIRIDTIIQDATRKQGDIEGRINVLKQEIAELERDIATRRGEIATLDADYKETTTVKERLVLAEKLSHPVPAAAPAAPAAGPTAPVAARSGIMPAGSVTLPGLSSALSSSQGGGAGGPGRSGR